MTRYDVVLTAGTERDLDQIVEHVAIRDSKISRRALLTRLLSTARTLSTPSAPWQCAARA